MNLDTQQWKEYRLGDIFEIKKGIYLPHLKLFKIDLKILWGKGLNLFKQEGR